MWGVIVGLLTGIWNGIETVALTLATVITTIWSIIRPILNPLWDAASWTYNSVLKPMWQWVSTHLDKLKQLYDDHVKPIIDTVYKVIATIKKIWHAILQPFFDFISALQQFLVITRLNQTAFGAWLDDELHQVYQFLNQLDARFEKPLNAILSVLNDIVLDIDGAFRYAITIRTTGKHIASISRQFWNAPLNAMASVRDAAGKLPHPRQAPLATTVTALTQQFAGEQGDLADNIDGARAIFLAVVNDDHEGADALMAQAYAPRIRLT
jgi:phage-related protein